VPRSSHDPGTVRSELGDGSFGGWYERPDENIQQLWRTGVEETREAIAAL
jgi:creatinine amidohydrolase